jgi:HAD superfamily hydrolase (TIGR01490 family)
MNGARGTGERVAAFFDVDGTLVSPPSLERRFVSELNKRRLVRSRNYFLWLAHAVRLLPRGIGAIQHGNKMYLRGVSANGEALQTGLAGLYREGVERLAWHAEQGHGIFLVSGTLSPLARGVALEIVLRLAARGITAAVGVWATRLVERQGRLTGRITGEAVFGEAKARAVRRLAQEHRLDLGRCFAYGNASSDRCMLETVGRPAAVNPSTDLARIARREGWPVLWWDRRTTESTQSSPKSLRTTEVVVGPRDLG